MTHACYLYMLVYVYSGPWITCDAYEVLKQSR